MGTRNKGHLQVTGWSWKEFFSRLTKLFHRPSAAPKVTLVQHTGNEKQAWPCVHIESVQLKILSGRYSCTRSSQNFLEMFKPEARESPEHRGPPRCGAHAPGCRPVRGGCSLEPPLTHSGTAGRSWSVTASAQKELRLAFLMPDTTGSSGQAFTFEDVLVTLQKG